MLSVEQALDQILAKFALLPPERIAIGDGLGRVLAEQITAATDLPPFANSSMDGFALRASDIATASAATPIPLRVVGDIAAGSTPTITLGQGQAMRIMTGAPLPVGADTIVPVEQTDQAVEQFRTAATPPLVIAILQAQPQGAYVRPVGEDIKRGQIILREGRILRAADLGVMAGLGVSHVSVIRRPVIAVISTGDELLAVAEPLSAGKIRDMNGYTIAAMAQALDTLPFYLGIAKDTVGAFREKLQKALELKADLILSTAGVSVGAFDVVKTVIESMGTLGFWKVNMRPGKPLMFGEVQGVPFLGLPGNPVSAMVTFDVFATPAILKMAGRPQQAQTQPAILTEVVNSDGRRTYMRVKLTRQEGKLFASSTGTQSSGALSSLVQADGLMIIPEGLFTIASGTVLPVRVFADTPEST